MKFNDFEQEEKEPRKIFVIGLAPHIGLSFDTAFIDYLHACENHSPIIVVGDGGQDEINELANFSQSMDELARMVKLSREEENARRTLIIDSFPEFLFTECKDPEIYTRKARQYDLSRRPVKKYQKPFIKSKHQKQKHGFK